MLGPKMEIINKYAEFGFYFSKDLIEKIESGKLIPGVSNLGDWLETLSLDELEIIQKNVEALFGEELEEDEESLRQRKDYWQTMDATLLVFHLYEMEMNEPPELKEEDICKYIEMLAISSALESMVRKDLIEMTKGGSLYLTRDCDRMYQSKSKKKKKGKSND
jgi:hypothetical protein